MSEQEKETTKNLWFAKRQNEAKVSLSTVYKVKKITEKELFKKKGEWRIESKNEKKAF